MARVSGNPVRLEEYTATTTPSLARATDALEDYRAALHRFEAEPNDLGTTLPDHSRTLDPTLADLRDLDRLPAAFAGALRELDGAFSARGTLSTTTDTRFRAELAARLLLPYGSTEQIQALTDARFDGDADVVERILDHEGVQRLRRMEETLSAHDGLATLGRTGYYAASLGVRAVHLRNHLGDPPYARTYHGNPALRAGHTRPGRRVLATQERRLWRHRTGTMRRQIATTRTALRTQVPVSPLGRTLATSQTAAAVRVGGKALGVVGAGFSAMDALHDYEQEDWGGVVSNVASIAGGVLMMINPLTAPVGAVLVLGSMIYELP